MRVPGTATERGNQHFAPALESFRKAVELGAAKGLPQALVDYELAANYSGMCEREKALTLLKTAADEGFMQDDRLEGDPEWNSLRSNKRSGEAQCDRNTVIYTSESSPRIQVFDSSGQRTHSSRGKFIACTKS